MINIYYVTAITTVCKVNIIGREFFLITNSVLIFMVQAGFVFLMRVDLHIFSKHTFKNNIMRYFFLI